MVEPIRYFPGNPHKDAYRPSTPLYVNEDLRRQSEYMVEDLYTDKDWLLQAGLGDMEFEQDMYDYFTETDNQLSLQGLREHNEYGGPQKYLERNPLQNKGKDYLGRYYDERMWKGPRQIDVNVDIISKANEKYRAAMRGRVPHEIDEGGIWGLKNAIFDVYGHEYGHGMKELNQFRKFGLEHPSIFYNTVQHGTHPGMVENASRHFGALPERYPEPPPGPWNDFQSDDVDFLGRNMGDLVGDIINDTTMYHGRSPLDENLRRRPEQHFGARNATTVY